jgi:hypothetical protein
LRRVGWSETVRATQSVIFIDEDEDRYELSVTHGRRIVGDVLRNWVSPPCASTRFQIRNGPSRHDRGPNAQGLTWLYFCAALRLATYQGDREVLRFAIGLIWAQGSLITLPTPA